jgi:hypothetical protein
MNMLACYDQAMSALSNALHSKDVSVVLKNRADLDHIKLRARQVRDRKLLADATEFQMRVERWLGALLMEAKAAGHLREGRPPKFDASATEPLPATLADIGVDRKLSMKVQHAAALAPAAFDAIVADMREKIAAGRSKIVSVISGGRQAKGRVEVRRSVYLLELLDGMPLGQVKLGNVRSRIERMKAELKILQAIGTRMGSDFNGLATIEDSISETVLDRIVDR